jgi:hypothetical protein
MDPVSLDNQVADILLWVKDSRDKTDPVAIQLLTRTEMIWKFTGQTALVNVS